MIIDKIRKTAQNAADSWRKKRDDAFERYGLQQKDVYSKGQFLSLPRDALMTVCYVDAYESVLSWFPEEQQFTLMDLDSCATHGSSFPSIEALEEHVKYLRELGLCKRYRIGTYGKDGWQKIMDVE